MTAFDDNHTTTGTDHPETSHQAAAKALVKSGSVRARILNLIATARGLTDEEIQTKMGIGPNTERPRRGELVAAGYVERSDERRLTAGLNKSIVWKVTQLGLEALAAANSLHEIPWDGAPHSRSSECGCGPQAKVVPDPTRVMFVHRRVSAEELAA